MWYRYRDWYIYILYIVTYVLFRIKIKVLFSVTNISKKKKEKKKDGFSLREKSLFQIDTVHSQSLRKWNKRQWKFTSNPFIFRRRFEPRGARSNLESIDSKKSISLEQLSDSDHFRFIILKCAHVSAFTAIRLDERQSFSWFLSSVKITAINRYRWIDLETERGRNESQGKGRRGIERIKRKM